MPSTSSPVSSEIEKLHTHLEGIWRETKAKWTDIDKFVQRDYPVWTRQQHATRPHYRPPTPARIIDLATYTQLSYTPRVHRDPPGDGDIHVKRASDLEPALTQTLMNAADELTWSQGGRNLLQYGYTVLEVRWDIEGRPARPRRKQGESDEALRAREKEYEVLIATINPICIDMLQPSTVLLDPQDVMPKEGIKTYDLFVKDLQDLTHKKVSQGRVNAEVLDIALLKDKNPYDLVTVIDYWNADWHSLKIKGGQHLYDEKNPMGMTPWIQVFSGFGHRPASKNGTDPQYQAVGLLEHVRESIRIEAQKKSGEHFLSMLAYFRPMGTTQDPADALRRIESRDMLPGQSGDYWIMPVPPVERWMRDGLQEVSEDIEIATNTRLLSGRREAGVDTVGQQVMMSRAAMRRYNLPAKAMETMATEAARRILKLVWLKKQPIRVGAKTLKPSDIDGKFNIQVTFESIDPFLALQQADAGQRQAEGGFISKRTWRERYGRFENEAQEQERLDDELVLNHPVTQSLLALKAAQRLGLGQEITSFFEEQAATELQRAQEAFAATPQSPPGPLPEAQGVTGEASLPRGIPLNGI